jgi:hypothetical protein
VQSTNTETGTWPLVRVSEHESASPVLVLVVVVPLVVPVVVPLVVPVVVVPLVVPVVVVPLVVPVVVAPLVVPVVVVPLVVPVVVVPLVLLVVVAPLPACEDVDVGVGEDVTFELSVVAAGAVVGSVTGTPDPQLDKKRLMTNPAPMAKGTRVFAAAARIATGCEIAWCMLPLIKNM